MCQIAESTSPLADINFWASVVTIISIFFALFVFMSDNCQKEKDNKEVYLNKLESLRFELIKNNNIILSFFNRDENSFKSLQKIPYYRFSTIVLNQIIATGVLQNPTLLRNLDAIADNKNQVNRILDIINLMGENSAVDSEKIKKLFEQRIKSAFTVVYDLNKITKQFLPKVIADLEKHITETMTKRQNWYCFHKYEKRKLPPEMFEDNQIPKD